MYLDFDFEIIRFGILVTDLWRFVFEVFVLLATTSKTYFESVLFRTSAYTDAKQASRVPIGSKQDNSPHNDDVKDVSVLLESELIAQYKTIDR